MDYWIVLDTASGSVLWRGQVRPAPALFKQVPAGAVLMVVPYAFIAQPEIDLAVLRAHCAAGIDAEAEKLRGRF